MSADESPAASDMDGCPKCGHDDVTTDSIATSGGGLTKFLDVQNRNFTVVSCTNCGYSELYRDVGSRSSDFVDFFLGG